MIRPKVRLHRSGIQDSWFPFFGKLCRFNAAGVRMKRLVHGRDHWAVWESWSYILGKLVAHQASTSCRLGQHPAIIDTEIGKLDSDFR